MFFPQLKEDSLFKWSMLFFNTPELTGKACAPSPDGRIDLEMTEEDRKKGKKGFSDK